MSFLLSVGPRTILYVCMWILFQPGDFGIKTSSMVSASMADWLVTKAQNSWIPNVDFQLPCGIASRRRLLCCWLVRVWMLRMLCCAMCWAPRKHVSVSQVDGTWVCTIIFAACEQQITFNHECLGAKIPWQPRLVFPICEGGCAFANSEIVAIVGWCYLDDANLSIKLCLFSNREHQILQRMIDCAATPWSKWLYWRFLYLDKNCQVCACFDLARIHSWKGNMQLALNDLDWTFISWNEDWRSWSPDPLSR